MEPKFILTLDGHLRIGNVQMHKDLLLPNDTCIGGGFWEVDPISMKLLLSGKSYDYTNAYSKSTIINIFCTF